MVPNRITRGVAASRALVLLATLTALVLALAACGSGGNAPTVAKDKAGDAETLNNVLGREQAAVRAFDRTLSLLDGAALVSTQQFRAQEQEHVNAIVKALRSLGEAAEPEQEEIESEGLKTRADALNFLYEVESASVAYDLRAISHLTYPWPRSLLGSIAANQAQHLVVLRRMLGSDLGESTPEAFEDGTTPPPSKEAE
jgi:hypothetical protein